METKGQGASSVREKEAGYYSAGTRSVRKRASVGRRLGGTFQPMKKRGFGRR